MVPPAGQLLPGAAAAAARRITIVLLRGTTAWTVGMEDSAVQLIHSL
jgi:hypothetical protein